MQYKKKAYTIAIIAFLTLSMVLAAIPMASAQPPTVALDPAFGNVGDEVTVTVTDVTIGGLVQIYWDSVKAWDGKAGLIAEGYAVGSIATIKIVIPAAIQGKHYVIAKDVEAASSAHKMFTVNPEIVLSQEKGLPGDKITVTGTGFAGESDIWTYFDSAPAYLQTGPSGEAAWTTVDKQVGDSSVYLSDAGVAYVDPDTYGAGRVAIPVDIAFKGITSLSYWFKYSDGPTGDFAFPYLILEIDTAEEDGVADDWVILEHAGESYQPTEDEWTQYIWPGGGFDEWFSVSGQGPSATLASIQAAIDGTVIAVKVAVGESGSVGVTAYIDDIEVNGDTYKLEGSVGEATTTALGSFEAVIEVPEVTLGSDYTVTAVDAEGNSADATILVDYYILVEPVKGPPGITVDVSGRITAEADLEVLFGTAAAIWLPAFIDTSDADGYFSGEYTLPTTIAAGSYLFKVLWEIGTVETSRQTGFEVTTPPEIVLAPTPQYPGKNVTVTGNHFCSEANVTIYLDTTVVAETVTDADGKFEVEFTVPSVAAGTYKVKAVDQYGASAEELFTVKPPLEIVIETRATEYLRGDTISIYANSTEEQLDAVLEIIDSEGYVWWLILDVDIEKQDGWYGITYQDQQDWNLKLSSDAPLGSWNFTAYEDSDKDKILDTNLFTVVERPTLAMILDRVDELDVKIDGLVSKADDIYVLIGTAKGEVLVKLGELDAKLVDIKDRVIVIDTALGEVRTLMETLNLDAINAVITSLNQTIATISSDIGGVTVSVDDIGLKVTSIEGDVAEIETSLGTIEGKVTSIDGKVATIETDVGVVRADVSDLVEREVAIDYTPIWIAVILSLIAAGAAIAAVVTIRQKIAG